MKVYSFYPKAKLPVHRRRWFKKLMASILLLAIISILGFVSFVCYSVCYIT